jgi:hypothetical protein
MVLFKTTLTGVSLLVLGLLLLTIVGQYVTMGVQQIQRRDIEPHAEFLVGDVADRSYSLPANVPVFGTVTVTSAPTNQSADIHFSVFDSANYQLWNNGGQANSIYSADKQGAFNFTFSTSQSGTYFFVFDNRASLFKKYVILSAYYNETTTSQVPDPRAQYVAWALVIIGGLVLVYGLARKAPVAWS